MYYILLLLSSAVLGYQWQQNDAKFDIIVGISVNNVNTGVGVFISSRTVITSANPLNKYLNDVEDIIIHVIHKSFNDTERLQVESVAGNQSFRKSSWIPVGYNDSTHTTIHDIALINVIKEHEIYINQHGSFYNFRKPMPVKLPQQHIDILNKYEWVFAGFGYIDHNHIYQNNVLEVTNFESAPANCDEWIPREWGNFICLVDNQDLAGVASGAPLFYAGDITTVLGIGCFSFKKDKDKILVFTNLIPYVNKLYGYIDDNE